ncbi:Glycosyltransferase [Quillaja saponaria]|uniref:Glycosyltransferase n=1 Tax=Quillaja saponaria TaxID=32244 RepID=A0AAD7LAP2_QUISA|nr:Glycosyltransferase [Quillaja saponaria]
MSGTIVHVALFPSAGMGHLTPFLRLAAWLIDNHCQVGLITPHPTVSLAESELISRFLSAFPQVNQIHFHLLPLDAATANSTDPFYLCGVSLISSVIPVTESQCLANYILFTSSVRMLSFFSFFPSVLASRTSAGSGSASFDGDVEIPEILPIPNSSIPPLLLVPNNLFANIFMEDSAKLTKLNRFLVNSFEGLEAQTLQTLDEEKSVVYVSFGSRTAMKWPQIREIGDGLMRSGCRFLWVVEDKPVDRDEEENLDEVAEHELMERMRKQGLVMNTWVNQEEVSSHKAVAGFVSHCGWNSVIEAAYHGVPILAWPQNGDQKINAEVVVTNGLGMLMKNWGWGGEIFVKGEEIGEAIKELMGNELLKMKAAELKEEAR